jgi:sarcosine oxidase, subunit gamma
MVDTLARSVALAGFGLPDVAHDVTVSDAGAFARINVRGGAAACAAAGRGFGVVLPTKPLAVNTTADKSALWLGPDEWLLLAPDGSAATIVRELQTALAGEPASVVDVSHRAVALRVAGPRAVEILASGCPLDHTAISVGYCARTIFGKAEIILWRRETVTYHVEVGRSFAPYVIGLMTQAARELS